MPRLPALLTALTLAGCAGAGLDLFGGSGPPGETAAVSETCPGFSDFDVDGGGFLDAAEFASVGTDLFRAWDDTGDGLLSFNEYNDCIGPNADDAFARADDNGDRMIGPDEFLDADRFAAWDRDGDGRLAEDEFLFDGSVD